MFENGLAVPKDEEKAFQLYRLSAIKGNPRAMNCLGKMYSLGLGCPTNPVQAEAWHKKAAKSGDGATFDSFGLPTGVVTSESNANAINQSK